MDTARTGSLGNIEGRGARQNSLMSYTWAPYGLESVVTWTLGSSSTGTHLRSEQSGVRTDGQQAYQGANHGWQGFLTTLHQSCDKLGTRIRGVKNQ
jgi:activator of Hsp90 ATPase-like protein